MGLAVRNLVSLKRDRVLSVADELRRGLELDSFVIITDHGIDEALYSAAQRAAASFFAQTMDVKLRSDIRESVAHRGYVPQSEAGDYADEGGIRRYEAFDVGRDLRPDHPLVVANTPLSGPNRWPADPDFQRATSALFEANASVTGRILELLEIAYDLRPGTFAQYRREPLSQLRYLNYFDAPAGASDHSAMGAHTDYEFITLLRELTPGLEVRLRNGSWHRTDLPPGSLILLAGDLLETVTNGQIQAALHRVPNITGRRFSMPFFAGADYSALVTPAPGMAAPDGQDREPVYAGPHLLRQLRRDFPYLRHRYPMPETIDLTGDADVSPAWGASTFEQRQMAAGG